MDERRGEVTLLLSSVGRGDDDAFQRLMSLVHGELHARAEAQMRRERCDHTLQPTALVNEVYLRLVDETQINCKDKGHFFALAATTMRRILIDHARMHQAAKRGHGRQRIPLEEGLLPGVQGELDVLDFDDILQKLESYNARLGQIAEMRIFGGLNYEEIAEVLGVGPRTVRRDWSAAKTVLIDEWNGRR